MRTANQYLNGMLGGGNGGVYVASPLTTGVFDFIIVTDGVTFTVMEDDAATDLLAAKALATIALSGSDKILSAGSDHTIKKLTYSGGQVYGYTFDDTSV